MALAFLNRCVWRATSTGTGSFVVASAITGYKVPESCAGPAVSDGSIYFYFAQSDDKTQWEIGHGVYTVATDTLTRATILDSTNAAAVVNFSAAPSVFMGGTLANDWMFSTVALNAEPINIFAGTNTSGDGAALNLTAGDGGGTGEGGAVTVSGGGGSGAPGGAFTGISGGGTVGGDFSFNGGSGSTGRGGHVNLTPGGGATNGGDLKVSLPAAGSGRQGLFIVTGLPTADPSVSGALWSNSGVLTVSA